MKKNLSVFLAAVMLMTSMTGCGGSGSNSDSSAKSEQTAEGEKVLNFGCQMYDDGSVNTVSGESSGWNCMRYGISECLFKFNDSMEVEPWLAESYTVNDEHTEWIITLKKDITFSDGCPLTPSKVKETFDYLKEMGPSGSAKPEKYLEFEATVTADDDANTITIVTSKPYANLPGQLAHPTMAILDIEDMKDFDNGAIGTGPYMIEQFNGVGVGYDMVKNPNYREEVPYDEVKILFMGDASKLTEEDIIKKYKLPKIDFLKVGHHGSKTSSSKEFISKINPKYSIISVGRKNKYGHPNKEVLNNLDNSKIYRTDQDGSIMFKIKDNKLEIETYSP